MSEDGTNVWKSHMLLFTCVVGAIPQVAGGLQVKVVIH